MDAIRIARAATGRETIVKIFGSYHGHHDYVMVSIGVPYDQIGDREHYASLPYGAGTLAYVPKGPVLESADRPLIRMLVDALRDLAGEDRVISLKVGGKVIPLKSGPHNDDVAIGTTGDLTLLEV